MASACRGRNRDGSTCQTTLYRCAKCGHVGCTKPGCSNQGFRNGNWGRCGHGNKSFA